MAFTPRSGGGRRKRRWPTAYDRDPFASGYPAPGYARGSTPKKVQPSALGRGYDAVEEIRSKSGYAPNEIARKETPRKPKVEADPTRADETAPPTRKTKPLPPSPIPVKKKPKKKQKGRSAVASPIDPYAAQIDAILGPQIELVNRQRSRASEEAQAQANWMRDVQATLIEMLKSVAPQIQGIYDTAANRSAGYAQGFSQEMARDINAAGQEMGDYAQRMGLGPEAAAAIQASTPGTAAGDVMYGVQGMIPAQGFQREGAAFASHAAGLPGWAGTEIAAHIAKFLSEAQSEDAEFDDKLFELESQRPKLRAEMEAAARADAYKERALRLEEAALLGREQDRAFNRDYKTVKLKEDTAYRRARLNLDRVKTAASLDMNERQFTLAVQREARLGRSAKNGGFTPTQKQKLSQLAFETASEAFYGQDSEGNEVEQRPPVEVLRDLIAAGVPFSIAVKAINRYWPHTRAWSRRRK